MSAKEGARVIRLDKYLADTGAASRREAKAYIRRGEVTVDGVPARAPEQKIAETAVVCLRGQPLRYQTCHYYMLHKPAGVLTATADRSQPTVLDLFPPELRRFGLVPAGRLDKDTTGLLILTDDGDYAHRMLAPKSHVMKRYEAVLDRPAEAADKTRFAAGIRSGEDCFAPALLEISPADPHTVWVEIREGKFHQVKRMVAACGKEVTDLERISMGPLSLDPSLELGEWRRLTAEEIKLLTDFRVNL